eukprot:529815-Prymnesium_polylepis.2
MTQMRSGAAATKRSADSRAAFHAATPRERPWSIEGGGRLRSIAPSFWTREHDCSRSRCALK